MPGPTDRIENLRADRIPSLHFIPQQIHRDYTRNPHRALCTLAAKLAQASPFDGNLWTCLAKNGGGSYLNTECRTHQQRCDEQTSPHRLSSRSLILEAQDEETVAGRRKIEKKGSKRLGPIRASYILA